jgi:hypothetical protein
MEQSQLIEFILTLEPEEKEQVRQFATLPFFNDGRMRTLVLPLLDICLNHPWHDPKQVLKKKLVFEKLFPGQVFVDGKLEKVMVEALKVVRAFLLTQYYFREANDFQQNFDFSEITRARGMDLRHLQLLTRLQKKQETFLWKNSTFFNQQFLLEKAIHDVETVRNQVKGDLNIPNVLQALELYYYLNRLSLLNFFLLQKKVVNISTSDMVESIFEDVSLPERYLEESPSLRINFEINKLLKLVHPEPRDVRSLFDLLNLYEHKLDPASLREFYTYLRNLCVLISNMYFDNEEIRVTLFELYKDNLIRGYLHYEGKLHPNTYLAVSFAAVRVNQFDWALDFVEKYKNELIGENETQDIYRLNLANYYFGIGQFSNCLDNIPPTSPFVDYLLHGKRLELKALYELQSDLLSYKLDAFKMFISRTSQKLLSEAQRQTNSDFANLLHQLVNSQPGDPKRSDLLISRINEKKQSAEWRWLLEKAKALKST